MIKNLKTRKVYARFKRDSWAADLAEMGSLSTFTRGVKYLLCFIVVFTKYAWVEPLRDNKPKTVINCFIGKVKESKRKANKLRVDQLREFYNSTMQK